MTIEPERAGLIRHVLQVQATVRTCDACGFCCTDAHNTMRILPVEAERIATHMRGLEPARRDALVTRLKETVTRYKLKPTGGGKTYTCGFLEPDLTCALPFDVKPVGCLAFNPVTVDECELDEQRFDIAHEPAEKRNTAAGYVDRRVPIPVSVLSALENRLPKHAPSAAAAGGGVADAPRASAGAKRNTTAGREAPVFLPRLLSHWHVASRRQAEAMVRAGRVTVNGTVHVDVLSRVRPGRDVVAVDGKKVTEASAAKQGFVYVLLNKPRGVVSTTHDPEGRLTVMDVASAFAAPGLAPAGRLDQDSAGALLLTNDHVLADRLLNPATHVAKTYRVKVHGSVTPETIARLASETVVVDGLTLSPITVAVESTNPRSTWITVTLREGKNRQIRRQLGHAGHEVEVLIRTAFGPLTLGDLSPGAARELTAAEVSALRRSRS